MNDSPSLEDIIATAIPPGVWGGEKLLARKIAGVLRAAGVVPAEPAGHDHDAWLSHLIDEWGHLGTVMKVFATLTDDQALRLLDAARARCELTPESLGATVAAVDGEAPAT